MCRDGPLLLFLLLLSAGSSALSRAIAPAECGERSTLVAVGDALELGLLLRAGLPEGYMSEKGNGYTTVRAVDYRGAPVLLEAETRRGRLVGKAAAALEAYVAARLQTCAEAMNRAAAAAAAEDTNRSGRDDLMTPTTPSPTPSSTSGQTHLNHHQKTSPAPSSPSPASQVALAAATAAACTFLLLGGLAVVTALWCRSRGTARGRAAVAAEEGRGGAQMTEIELD